MVDRRWLATLSRGLPVIIALACLAPGEARALKVLLTRHNQSQVHTWDSSNPGVTTQLHATKCNDADYNLPEGSTHGWIAEHNADYFARFIVGSNNGFDQQYILGQGGRTHYAYPKHVTVHNGEVVVMSRNDGTLWRYTTAGVQLGSVKTASNTGQGMASDGTNLFVSLWGGAVSSFVRYDAAFAAQQNFNNPSGMGNFNNIVDFVHDPITGHFFGLATTGEGGTATNSTTVLEFEMGGAVTQSYALPFACDGIGSFVATVCGDAKLDPGEQCDDGNKLDTDACTSACKLATCGDGLVQAGVEACDDGNNVDEDECTSACELPACGDGFVQGDEACDDGNAIDEDECTGTCAVATCGDGFVHAGVESCDDANDIDDDACSNACVAATCGDGVVQDGEACDDPNDPDCVDCMIVAPGTTTTGDATTTDETTSTTDPTTTDPTTSTTDPTTATTTSGTGGSGGGTGDPTDSDPPPTTDPDPPPTTDATTSGSSSSTGTSEAPTDDGGCGCRSNPNGERGALLALLTLFALTRRRRTA